MRLSTVVGSALLMISSASAFAAEGTAPVSAPGAGRTATLTLNLPALSYQSGDSKVKKDGGSSETVKADGFTTADVNGTYAEISLGSWNLYYFPFISTEHLVQGGYMINEMLEVGLTLGINSYNEDKPIKTKSSSNTVGAFITYTPTLANVEWEFILDYRNTNVEKEKPITSTTTGVSVKQKTSTTGDELTASAMIVIPLATNVHYLGGLSYTAENAREKIEDVKTTTAQGFLTVNLATIRMITN